MNSLTTATCAPCESGIGLLEPAAIAAQLAHVPSWQVVEEGKAIRRDISTKNYASALEVVQKISGVAEAEGHHPDVLFGWGYVEICLTTHSAGGLTLNDFIVAAKMDTVLA